MASTPLPAIEPGDAPRETKSVSPELGGSVRVDGERSEDRAQEAHADTLSRLSPFAYMPVMPPRTRGTVYAFKNVVEAITELARDAIRDGTETGGKLLGKREHTATDGWIFFVEAHLGPEGGGREVHLSTYFRGPGSRNLAAKARWYFDRYGLDYLGEWHLHPRGVIVPSEGDRRTLAPLLESEPIVLAPIVALHDEDFPEALDGADPLQLGLFSYVLKPPSKVAADRDLNAARFLTIRHEFLDDASEAPREADIPEPDLEPYLITEPDDEVPPGPFADVGLDHPSAERIRAEAGVLLAEGHEVELGTLEPGRVSVRVALHAGTPAEQVPESSVPLVGRMLDLRLDSEYPDQGPRWVRAGRERDIPGLGERWQPRFGLVDVVDALERALARKSVREVVDLVDRDDDTPTSSQDDRTLRSRDRAESDHRERKPSPFAKRSSAASDRHARPDDSGGGTTFAQPLPGVSLAEIAVALAGAITEHRARVAGDRDGGRLPAPIERFRFLLVSLHASSSTRTAAVTVADGDDGSPGSGDDDVDAHAREWVLRAAEQLARELPDAVFPLPYWRGNPMRLELDRQFDLVLSGLGVSEIESARRALTRLFRVLARLLSGTPIDPLAG